MGLRNNRDNNGASERRLRRIPYIRHTIIKRASASAVRKDIVLGNYTPFSTQSSRCVRAVQIGLLYTYKLIIKYTHLLATTGREGVAARGGRLPSEIKIHARRSTVGGGGSCQKSVCGCHTRRIPSSHGASDDDTLFFIFFSRLYYCDGRGHYFTRARPSRIHYLVKKENGLSISTNAARPLKRKKKKIMYADV